MKKLLCLILIHYIFSIFDVYADTIAVFPIKCKKDSINVTTVEKKIIQLKKKSANVRSVNVKNVMKLLLTKDG